MFKYSLAAIALYLSMSGVPAMGAGGGGQLLAFMATAGRTSQPIGHYEFCKQRLSECQAHSAAAPVALDEPLWGRLVAVNDSVNARLRPVPDIEVWGKPEVWSYPETVGDCEDYVLLKRRALLRQGWPAADLLITVVRQTNGDGHAVLTVRTDRGDMILDNLEPSVLLWSRTAYQFVKRQSESNSGQWVAISDDRTMLVGSVTR